jgi:hypothetical protein
VDLAEYMQVSGLATHAAWPGIETRPTRVIKLAYRKSERNAWSAKRRMRDSNSRGVATNTLSKSVG